MATTGDLPRRGEVWWVRVDKRRPAIVVQTDQLDDPRILSFLVVPLTSRLHMEGLAGNVRLDREVTGLTKPSIANVFDIQKVFRADFEERAGVLSQVAMESVDEGLRLVLDL